MLVCVNLLGCSDRHGIPELKNAIATSNYKEIADAMEQGDILGTFDPVRYSWALNGDKDMIQFLLEHGADVNATDSNGNTLLMLATGIGKDTYIVGPSYMEIFINYGADVNKGNCDGLTPINYAAKNAKKNSCNLLIQNGAIVTNETLGYALNAEGDLSYTNYSMIREIVLALKDQQAEYQLTPILDAAICGDSDEVIRLWNDDFSKKEGTNDALLFNVVAFCSSEALEYISEGISLETKVDAKGQNALYIAATNENVDVVEFLLQNNTYGKNYLNRLLHDVFQTGNLPLIQILYDYSGGILWGETSSSFDWRYHDNPLLDVVTTGNIDLIYKFIDWGYPLDEVTAHLAMEKAIQSNEITMLRSFLDMGFDVNFDGNDGHGTLLYTACCEGSLESLKCILSYGADPNQFLIGTSKESQLALFNVVEKNDLEKFKLLISYGANPNLVNDAGQTIADCAKDRGAFLILDFLSDENNTFK